jgi:hypothetical protein
VQNGAREMAQPWILPHMCKTHHGQACALCLSAVRGADCSLDQMWVIRDSSYFVQELARWLGAQSVISVVGQKRVTEVRDPMYQNRTLLGKNARY